MNLFIPGTPVSSTNKNDRHDITEILLKVALNTIIEPCDVVRYGECSVLLLISLHEKLYLQCSDIHNHSNTSISFLNDGGRPVET
jgi:hypothetical protein